MAYITSQMKQVTFLQIYYHLVMQHQTNIDVALGKYNHAFGQYYFCPVILRLIRGRQNAHAGYVNEPSLVTTEPFSVMTVMNGFT